MATSLVPSIFFKAYDVLNYLTLTEFKVYTCMQSVFGDENIFGVRELVICGDYTSKQ